MKILAIKTDQPTAELWLYEGDKQLAHIKWQAHLKLAETLNSKIEDILNKLSISLSDLEGIVYFKGPGSFTGLRIGLSVANALAYANELPIVARTGEDWLTSGMADIMTGKNDKIAAPFYDRPAATTKPKN